MKVFLPYFDAKMEEQEESSSSQKSKVQVNDFFQTKLWWKMDKQKEKFASQIGDFLFLFFVSFVTGSGKYREN